MTADSPAQTTREPVPVRSDRVPVRSGRAGVGVPAPTILSMCDHLLGEVGRRHHMFAWLRAPGAGAGEWLGLLTLDPPVLGNDRKAVGEALARQFLDLEHAPKRGATRTGRATNRPAPEWTPVKVEHTPVPRGFVQALGVVAGLAFAALLIVEIYLGVIVVAFGAGRLVLGLAILIEALSRAGGTVAAERAGRRAWACACAIVGAPVVAWVSLVPRSTRIATEPAPLAGLLALLAGAVALVGVITGT